MKFYLKRDDALSFAYALSLADRLGVHFDCIDFTEWYLSVAVEVNKNEQMIELIFSDYTTQIDAVIRIIDKVKSAEWLPAIDKAVVNFGDLNAVRNEVMRMGYVETLNAVIDALKKKKCDASLNGRHADAFIMLKIPGNDTHHGRISLSEPPCKNGACWNFAVWKTDFGAATFGSDAPLLKPWCDPALVVGRMTSLFEPFLPPQKQLFWECHVCNSSGAVPPSSDKYHDGFECYSSHLRKSPLCTNQHISVTEKDVRSWPV